MHATPRQLAAERIALLGLRKTLCLLRERCLCATAGFPRWWCGPTHIGRRGRLRTTPVHGCKPSHTLAPSMEVGLVRVAGEPQDVVYRNKASRSCCYVNLRCPDGHVSHTEVGTTDEGKAIRHHGLAPVPIARGTGINIDASALVSPLDRTARSKRHVAACMSTNTDGVSANNSISIQVICLPCARSPAHAQVVLSGYQSAHSR